MHATSFIRESLETSRETVLALLNDLRDEPLTSVREGGNHALWILGHLVYVESWVVNVVILGRETCPHESWGPLFGTGSRPAAGGEGYPSFEALLEAWGEVRASTLSALEQFTDDDLDRASPGCPEEYKAWFGTIGKAFGTQIFHPTMHYGQLSDIRRSLGREVLMA